MAERPVTRKRLVIKGAVLAVLLAVAAFMLHCRQLSDAAKGRYHDLQNGAQTVFFLAERYRSEGHALEQGSGRLGDAGFGAYLADNTDWTEAACYALVLDDQGKVQCALCGYRPVSGEVLAAPPQLAGDGEERDRMLRTLKTPLRWKSAVGTYFPATISSSQKTETE